MKLIANKWRPDITHLLDALRTMLNMLKIKYHLMRHQQPLSLQPEPAVLMVSINCLKKLLSIVVVQCRTIGRTIRFLEHCRELSISHS